MEKSKLFWISFTPSIFSLIAITIILFLEKFLPPKLPLFYSLPWGDKQLANIPQFLIIPGVIICISLLNLMVFLQLHGSQFLFKRILLLSSFVSGLILLISLAKIVSIFI